VNVSVKAEKVGAAEIGVAIAVVEVRRETLAGVCKCDQYMTRFPYCDVSFSRTALWIHPSWPQCTARCLGANAITLFNVVRSRQE